MAVPVVRDREHLEWLLIRGRLAARRARELARGALTRPSREPITFAEVRSGPVTARLLEPGDSHAWTRSMRANESRMHEWWSTSGDWHKNTDAVAFASHLGTWRQAARKGTGLSIGLVGAEGLAGELQFWNISHDRRVVELGLWAAPGQLPPRAMVGAIGGALDQLFHSLPLQRMEAPVHVDNSQPRKILRIARFSMEGRLANWRPCGEEMADYDLFATTDLTWPDGRQQMYRMSPWEPLLAPELQERHS